MVVIGHRKARSKEERGVSNGSVPATGRNSSHSNNNKDSGGLDEAEMLLQRLKELWTKLSYDIYVYL